MAVTPQAPKNDELKPLDATAIGLWKSRLDRAKVHHTPYWERAEEFRREYLGPKDPENRDRSEFHKGHPVNKIADFVNILMPMVIPDGIAAVVGAKWDGQEYTQGAERLEARILQVLARPYLLGEIEAAVLEAFFLTGFVYQWWNPRTSLRVVVNEPQGEDFRQGVLIDKARAAGNEYANPDEPYMEHLPFRTVRIDPQARHLSRAAWFSWEDETRWVELIADDVANNKASGIYHDTLNIQPEGPAGQEAEWKEGKGDTLIRRINILQPGRREGELELIVLAGNTKTEIRHDFLEFGVEGYPVSQLTFHPTGRLFPPSPLQFWFDQQSAFNEFMAEATEAAKRAKKIGLVPDSHPDVETKIADTPSGHMLAVPDPREVVAFEIGGVTRDTWDALNALDITLEKSMGIGPPQMGIEGGQTRRTAREVVAREQHSQNRLGWFRRRTNGFYRDLITKGCGMLLKFGWHDVPVKIDRGGGQHDFAMFSNKTQPANPAAYDYNIDVAAQERSDPIVREKRAQDLLALLADANLQEFAAREGVQLSVVAPLQDALEAMGVRNIDRYIIEPSSPEEQAQEQQEAAMQENQVMSQTGEAVPVDPTNDDHQVHIQVHSQALELPAVAEHLAEHYGYLEQQGGEQEGEQGGVGQGTHDGPARRPRTEMEPGGEPELVGAAGAA